jgi:hypothetical protein
MWFLKVQEDFTNIHLLVKRHLNGCAKASSCVDGQDSASALAIRRVGQQDSASAHALHPRSPCPYRLWISLGTMSRPLGLSEGLAHVGLCYMLQYS